GPPAAPRDTCPSYGFGPDVENDHFLFHVYAPKAPSPFAGDSDPIVVALKFISTPVGFSNDHPPHHHHDDRRRHTGMYEDVAAHMEWSTQSALPYISTSFRVLWRCEE
ncbi:hypothetical protein H0H87_009697, partial [Tephrocybe sp. NHM501043]